MKLSHPDADLYIPDNAELPHAIARTTHLGIGAHQDDLEIFAYHGIATCYRQRDQWFGGVTVTDGAGSPRTGIYANYTDAEMKAVRKTEQRQAASLGQYAFQAQLAYASTTIKDAAQSAPVADLQQILAQAQPQVVYLHNPADKHDTHIAVLLRSLTALRALPAEKRPRKAYGCEVWRDLDWLPDADKVALDVSAYPHLAASLLGVYDSQISGGKRYDLATHARRIANATYHHAHCPDVAEALTWAIDLTPLIQTDTLDLLDYTTEFLNRFRADVAARIYNYL